MIQVNFCLDGTDIVAVDEWPGMEGVCFIVQASDIGAIIKDPLVVEDLRQAAVDAQVISDTEMILRHRSNMQSIPDSKLSTIDLRAMQLLSLDDDEVYVAFTLVKSEIDRRQKAASEAGPANRAKAVRKDMRYRYERIFVNLGRRDGFRCKHCDSSDGDLQIDHIHPVSRGGDNEIENLQLLCSSCNAAKGDR